MSMMSTLSASILFFNIVFISLQCSREPNATSLVDNEAEEATHDESEAEESAAEIEESPVDKKKKAKARAVNTSSKSTKVSTPRSKKGKVLVPDSDDE